LPPRKRGRKGHGRAIAIGMLASYVALALLKKDGADPHDPAAAAPAAGST